MCEILSDLEVVVNVKYVVETLNNLNRGILENNPFTDSETKDQFQRVFGQPNATTYRIANAQKYAYITFMDILSTIQQRWLTQSNKQKAIRFEKDPEWQPDDRVVLFQHFFEGNRTWVLTDFDRHVLAHWKPNGSSVIFGDRFIHEKLEEGYALCTNCGMLEQHPQQFGVHNGKKFCSEQCVGAYISPVSTDKNNA